MKAQRAASFIKNLWGEFDVAVVLGSGVKMEETLESIPYEQIPDMPSSYVEGHENMLSAAEFSNVKALIFMGRFHYYEGRQDWEIRFIPELSKLLGCKIFISTTAVGAVSDRAASSDLVLAESHINLTGKNPLVGLIKDFGTKVFVDMKGAYDPELLSSFESAAKNFASCSRGVIATMLGPNYETEAEIRFLKSAGVDAVNMSTAPEIIAARFFGLNCLCVGVVANATTKPTSHEEVLKNVSERNKKLRISLTEFLNSIHA